MKKILISFIAIVLAGGFSVNALLAGYDVSNDFYVCDESAFQADFQARVLANREEMARASFCKCDQMPAENKDKVKKGKWEREGYVFEYGKCEAPQNKVYRCYCIGTDTY